MRASCCSVVGNSAPLVHSAVSAGSGGARFGIRVDHTGDKLAAPAFLELAGDDLGRDAGHFRIFRRNSAISVSCLTRSSSASPVRAIPSSILLIARLTFARCEKPSSLIASSVQPCAARRHASSSRSTVAISRR